MTTNPGHGCQLAERSHGVERRYLSNCGTMLGLFSVVAACGRTKEEAGVRDRTKCCFSRMLQQQFGTPVDSAETPTLETAVRMSPVYTRGTAVNAREEPNELLGECYHTPAPFSERPKPPEQRLITKEWLHLLHTKSLMQGPQ